MSFLFSEYHQLYSYNFYEIMLFMYDIYSLPSTISVTPTPWCLHEATLSDEKCRAEDRFT